MGEQFVSRGFVGKPRQPEAAARVPPGQHLTRDFPVLSAGPTPRVRLEQRTFSSGLIWRLTRTSSYFVSCLRRAGFRGGWLAAL